VQQSVEKVTKALFRYPTPGGRIPADPPAEDLRRDMAALRALIAAVRGEPLGMA
jgi:hypothetical protein